MNPLDLLKGKQIMVMTDVKVEVPLTIERVESKHNSRNLEPATKENDWWPAQQTWTTYLVYFTNGHMKVYNSIEEIKLIE